MEVLLSEFIILVLVYNFLDLVYVVLLDTFRKSLYILHANHVANGLEGDPEVHLELILIRAQLTALLQKLVDTHTVSHHALQKALLLLNRHALSSQRVQVNSEILSWKNLKYL